MTSKIVETCKYLFDKWWGGVGGPFDYCVTPFSIGLGFEFGTALGLDLGLRGPDLGLGLFNFGLIYI